MNKARPSFGPELSDLRENDFQILVEHKKCSGGSHELDSPLLPPGV
jgi:hypothetical protein